MTSIDDLDTFLAIAGTGHMGRAAQTLGLTQPALSARLRKLEARMDTRLFDRQAAGMRLTQAGRDLLDPARHARSTLRRLGEHAHATRSGETRPLRLGMTLLSALSRVPLLLRRVEQRAPELRFALHEAPSSPLEQLVAENELDLAFVHPPISREDLTTRTLFSEPMVLCVPADWRVPEHIDSRAEWLRRQRMYWVGPQIGPHLHARVAAWMKRCGLECTSSAQVSSYVIAQSFVAAAAGVALVPRSVSQLHARQVRVVPVEGRPPELPFALVRRKRESARAYELICEAAAEDPDGRIV